jgi:hypothetical protein
VVPVEDTVQEARRTGMILGRAAHHRVVDRARADIVRVAAGEKGIHDTAIELVDRAIGRRRRVVAGGHTEVGSHQDKVRIDQLGREVVPVEGDSPAVPDHKGDNPDRRRCSIGLQT